MISRIDMCRMWLESCTLSRRYFFCFFFFFKQKTAYESRISDLSSDVCSSDLIYEGTTAIQANDFIGRKTLRDGAAIALAMADDMRATVAELVAAAAPDAEHKESLELIARRLDAAITGYDQATDFVLANAGGDPRAVFYGSVPYLMLSGTVNAGWQMARAAQACVRELEAGSHDAFYMRKLATSVFYAGHILPRCHALSVAVIEGQVVSKYSNGVFSI